MIPTAEQLVIDALYSYVYGCNIYENETDVNVDWSPQDVNNYIDLLVEDKMDEQYDEEVFPIIATRSIRKKLDLKMIADEMEKIGWEEFTELLFDGDW